MGSSYNKRMKRLIFIALVFICSALSAQTVLTIEGTAINNTDPSWQGFNVPHETPTILTYRNNSITSVNTSMYLLQAGDDYAATTINNLDAATITGNKFVWNGTLASGIITHGLFCGFNINQTVKWNYLQNCPYNIIFKSGGTANPNMNITSGGAAYNIIKGGRFSGRSKGINGARFYNNTLYGDANSWYLILITDNSDNNPPFPGNPSTGTKIKNNIFYTTTQTPAISIQSGSLSGFECDYNVYYCEAGNHEPVFNIDGTIYTWAQWKARGYDAHSALLTADPFVDHINFVPKTRMDYGTNLGSEWQQGLSVSATWIVGTSPATTSQNGSWQVGARVYAAASGGKHSFYVRNGGNDLADGLTDETAWSSITKVNSSITAGDTVYFKRGNIWIGKTIIPSTSGTSDKPIVYGAYSSGTDPVISGFTTVSGWTNYGSGIYSKAISASSSPLMVTVNGVNTAKGRWPTTDYYLPDAVSGNTQLTDADLNGHNFVNGELVIRTNMWTTYRTTITGHSASTITFGWDSYYSLPSNNGYFIQNDIDLCDALGEWAYVNGVLYMYFGSASPDSYTIKVASIDRLADLTNKDFITFQNITFEGSNSAAIYTDNSAHITVSHCAIRYNGGRGIDGAWHVDSSYITVTDCNFDNNNDCGINLRGDHKYATITKNTINYTGMIEGLAGTADGCGIGISVGGIYSVINHNVITHTAYNAISFGNQDVLATDVAGFKISNNFINYHCQNKCDGAGIYTYETSGTGSQVWDNIVMNGKSHPSGINGWITGMSESIYHEHDNAHGIYLDGSDNVDLQRNVCYNNEGAALFVNTCALHTTAEHSTFYANRYGVQIVSDWGGMGAIRDFIFRDNKIIARDATQLAIKWVTFDGDTDIKNIGIMDYNHYGRPIDDSDCFSTQYNAWNGPATLRTLAGWKTYSTLDVNSSKSYATVTTTDDLHFIYNETESSKIYTLSANMVEVDGTSHPAGSLSLPSWGSLVLIGSGTVTEGEGIKEGLIGTDDGSQIIDDNGQLINTNK
jgi:parallel beta-helix repeat protein